MRTLTLIVQDIAKTGRSSEIISSFGVDEVQFFERFVASLLQQLVEKIDRVREVAGR